jgi:hypothetical protein
LILASTYVGYFKTTRHCSITTCIVGHACKSFTSIIVTSRLVVVVVVVVVVVKHDLFFSDDRRARFVALQSDEVARAVSYLLACCVVEMDVDALQRVFKVFLLLLLLFCLYLTINLNVQRLLNDEDYNNSQQNGNQYTLFLQKWIMK